MLLVKQKMFSGYESFHCIAISTSMPSTSRREVDRLVVDDDLRRVEILDERAIAAVEVEVVRACRDALVGDA